MEGRGKNRTQRLVIYYKFVGYLEIPANLSAPNYKADLRQGVAVEYVSCEPTGNACEMADEEDEATLVGLITRRASVQIFPKQNEKRRQRRLFSFWSSGE